MSNDVYDAIVVGAGAGGGVVAARLAEAGKRVLILERGGRLDFETVPRDHLRNQRLSQYGHNAGPDDRNPRVTPTGRVVLPWQGGYHANASGIGSGTVVYGAQAWRFHPIDFQMASVYGVPEGSSLADWPISYEDLAPNYERVEHELGVCGDAAKITYTPPYTKPYPMPPMPVSKQGQVLRRGLDALGWHTLDVPLAINSQEYNGRPACVRCQQCVGFACPVDAKNGTQNTYVPRALATGKATLLSGCPVEKVDTDSNGRVVGVTYISTATGERQTVSADVVVLACGAVESARLLLLSRNEKEKNGLGNNFDQVGRNLQGHYYPGVAGLFEEDIWDGLGPGVTTATTQFNHGNDGIIGGSMLADEFIVLPAIFWKRLLPPEVPRWGIEAKRWMRENYRRVSDVKGPTQEIPNPEARVTLDAEVTDAWGLPVARFSGTAHEETVKTARFMFEKAEQWMKAAGAVKTWGSPPGKSLSGGQHQAGTCRMGFDPQTSVVNEHCRVHGHDNLFVADTSVHVTNGGFNPFLTAMALADRTSDYIVREW